jgi:hypothetical protein
MIDHDDEQLTFPKWSATGGIYFWDKLLNNHLDLKAGVSGKAYSSYLGKEFNQQAQVYLLGNQLYNIEQTGVVDLVILLHIGKAYIHFIWIIYSTDNTSWQHFIRCLSARCVSV